MELNVPTRRTARTPWSLLAAFLLIAGCEAQPETTGVRLAIGYQRERVPARLRVEGMIDHGLHYGPVLLPDPPRALSADGETVLLQLRDDMDGRMLTLDVAGLDAAGGENGRASQRVRVMKGSIAQVALQLEPVLSCTPELQLADGSCKPSEPPDAGETPQGGTQAPPPVRGGDGSGLPIFELPDAGMHVLQDAGPLEPETRDAGAEPAPVPDAGEPDAGCGMDCPSAGSSAPPLPDAGSAGSAAPPPPRCGDGTCQPAQGETRCTCAADCGASTCGDGVCCPESGENPCGCSKDCGASSCGDGLCCAATGENACGCAKDCGASSCGDHVCCAAAGENACSCAMDCGTSSCGDGVCCVAAGENACNCAKDCGASSCGDGVCCAAAGETSCSCAKDCGAPVCGDGVCCATGGEDACTCAKDCPGACASACTAPTCAYSCENAASCVASCSGSSACDIRCKNAKDCSGVTCSAPAKCSIDCEGAINCVFAFCPSGAMSCPKHRLVCNEPCPPE